jgi:signal recognition particle receptor subunit beta
MVGLTSSGKTKLFYSLVTHKSLFSVTSQVRNEWPLLVGKRIVNLVDVPGHPRVRTEVLSAVKTADAIVLVLDSESFLKVVSDIGNFLYDLLSVPEVVKKRIPFLIVGSKSDLPNARSVTVIRDELQKEIDAIRENRQQSDYVEIDAGGHLFLGREGIPFDFGHLRNPVTFGSCSVNNNDVGTVIDFIDGVAK